MKGVVITALEEGALVGERFRLLRRLGQGGMGQVWAATNIATRRRVALKLLSPRIELSNHAIKRLQREARLASQLEHPHVIDVLDLLETRHGPMMVMELLRGETLAERMEREGAIPLELAAGLLAQITSAVGAAHERGIVHRDLKPTNIFITEPDGVVKVLDFGIARIAQSSDTLHDTATGQMIGTPVYMAPEQHCAEPNIDHRADIWAMGVLTYEILSGKRPLDGRASGSIMEQLTTVGVPPLRALVPDAPFELAVVAKRLLERDRDRRPDDLRSLAVCLAKHTNVVLPAFGAANSIDMADEADEATKTTTEAPTELAARAPSGWSSFRWGASVVLVAAVIVWAGRSDDSVSVAPAKPMLAASDSPTWAPPVTSSRTAPTSTVASVNAPSSIMRAPIGSPARASANPSEVPTTSVKPPIPAPSVESTAPPPERGLIEEIPF